MVIELDFLVWVKYIDTRLSNGALGVGEIMKSQNVRFVLGSLAATFLVLGCQSRKEPDLMQNFVTADSALPQKIGDEKSSFVVTTKGAVLEGQGSKADKASSKALVLGYPLELIGEANIFGGTITEVSDREDENLGGLKMSSLSLLHVTTALGKSSAGKDVLNLKGCVDDCGEGSEIKILVSIPVVKLDAAAKLAYIDISALGSSLDIIDTFGGAGENSPWKHLVSAARSFDYSLSTLTFDVVSKYEYKAGAPGQEKIKNVDLTTRWYLRLASNNNAYFERRAPTPEVGFFLTDRSKQKWITRFPVVSESSGPIKYYIKNVPNEYRAGFVDAFEAWNDKLNSLFSGRFLDYEFLEPQDPRNKVIVAGDIRFNVLEWDLVNKAGYGGLGPSIAHQGTGQVFSAQVLIQGPTIEQMYKGWFGIGPKPNVLALQQKAKTSYFEIKIGTLKSYIPSQDPRLHDALEIRVDFEKPPEGYDYDSYMRGYFRDMVAHEVGHNLGLRHNFRGNLASNNSQTLGSVSRSVMEYLNGSFRHLDTVGEYDVMAIAYGYLGVIPQHSNWFCTDENTTPESSAECSSADATNDPFGYFQYILNLAMAKSVNLGSAAAPDWTAADLERKLGDSVNGLARYASSAVGTAKGWTNFFGKENRPKDPLKVPAYVVTKMRSYICNPNLDKAAQSKDSAEAKVQTEKNLQAVRTFIVKTLADFQKPFPLGTAQFFPCLDFSAVAVEKKP